MLYYISIKRTDVFNKFEDRQLHLKLDLVPMWLHHNSNRSMGTYIHRSFLQQKVVQHYVSAVSHPSIVQFILLHCTNKTGLTKSLSRRRCIQRVECDHRYVATTE